MEYLYNERNDDVHSTSKGSNVDMQMIYQEEGGQYKESVESSFGWSARRVMPIVVTATFAPCFNTL